LSHTQPMLTKATVNCHITITDRDLQKTKNMTLDQM